MKQGKKEDIVYIDFMAGVAMLMIVLVHSPQALIGISDKITNITSYGEMGCQCFFLLTGFKLCLSYHRREVSLCKFYLKRWMSIAPLYYLAICIGFILTRIYDSPNCPTFLIGCWRQNTDVKAILANILLIHNLFINGNNDVVGGGWYIGVTFLFYILFPLFVSFFDYIHKRFHSLTMFLPFLFWGCMVFIRNICIISGVSEFINCGYMSFFEQAPCILLGMLLYYQYADGELDFNIKEKGKLAFLLIILLI